MADNDGGLVDGRGRSSDWIELFNPTSDSLNLAGWSLRDRTNTWTFPTVMLPAGGFLVVFASDEKNQPYRDPAGFWHTNFRLDAAGETLALVRPEGPVAWEFANPGPQPRGRSFGLPQTVTRLTTFTNTARLWASPGLVSEAWRTDARFDDHDWISGQASAGYGTAFARVGGLAAYQVNAGTSGNQDYGGSLGMDFVVRQPVVVTELGCFDDGSDGLHATIRVQLWRRNESGTPDVFSDDAGESVLAAATFAPSDSGSLSGGSRFKSLAAPLTLAPGAYTIVASGYSATERNGNFGVGSPNEPWETHSGDGSLAFVGGARYGVAGSFPGTVDGGPANRYAAGTFRFAGPDDPLVRTALSPSAVTGSPGVLMRIPFVVSDPTAFEALELRLGYDDGVVVWLNGTEVVRRNAPDPLRQTSTATLATNALDTIPIPARGLVAGTNLLALHGLNVAINDPDFFLGAALSGIATAFASPRSFAVPTPGAPNPADGVAGYAVAPRFSETRGFRREPFTLALESATAGASIWYTVDGSRPGPTNGTLYHAPIKIASTTVVRASASLPGLQESVVVTHSFLFARDVAVQPATPPPGYPSSWIDAGNGASVVADYGMVDSISQSAKFARAAGNSAYTVAQARTALAASIEALPVLSVVTDRRNLFDPATGIYLHPSSRGEAWERPVSVELLSASGAETWQVDAGLHVMGLTSRSLQVTPKLNFMLVFGEAYGDPWLREPFFGEDGPARIKRIALRSNTRDGWVAEYFGFGTATYIADGFAKEAARESGEPGTRHRYCHLFLNGLYWGVYNPTERPEAHWAETTFGGEDEDYDVLDLCCGNQLESGDFTEWRELLNAAASGFRSDVAYQAILGNDPTGQRDPMRQRLLGVDSFIGFAINGYYHASVDWPGNFFAAFDNLADRTAGWRFITWDTDLGMPNLDWNANKVSPPEGFNHPWWQSSPGVVDAGLRQNAEYRMRLADRVYREFFHEGAYTTERNLARWQRLRDALQPGLYAESARWGDYRPGGLRTVQEHWLPRVNGAAATAWFNRRNAVVIQQLRAAGLYPSVAPPEFQPFGGEVNAGSAVILTHTNAVGQIRYTLDGRDPRLAADAPVYTGPIPITAPVLLRARFQNGTTWSALNEAAFRPRQDLGALQFSEVHYHPPDRDGVDGDEAEFLELLNAGTTPLDLSGVVVTQGIQFAFTNRTMLAPGQYWVLARDADVFRARYPGAPLPNGLYAGKLENAGEEVTLALSNANAAATPFLTVHYESVAPWPAEADGTGWSLQRASFTREASQSLAWIAAIPTPGSALPADLRDTDSDGMSDGWEVAHDLDPRVDDADLDADADGLTNREEFLAGTNPREASDRLRFEDFGVVPFGGGSAVVLGFSAKANKTYAVLEREGDADTSWRSSARVEAEPRERFVSVTNAIPVAGVARWFRLVTPWGR